MADKKVVLITGASSGIGLATALQLLKRKHVVYGAARRVSSMAPIEQAGGHTLELDVTDESSMSQAVQSVIEREGRVDVLVNNAGYGSYGAVEDVPMEEARRQIEVNIFGLARMTQLVLPHMRRLQRGTIINISSMGGVIYTPLGAWYHATKHAVEGFSDAMRLELEPHGIHVVIVAPGAINTGFNEIVREQVLKTSGDGPYADMANAMANAAAPNRGSKPRVIANVITKAIEAERPKTRYRAGQFSRLLVYLRRLLPDRAFDRVVKAAIG